MAMMCNALLAARSPPRLSRWRTVFPEEAGTGLTPHNDAKLASDRNLSGLSPAVRGAARFDLANRIAGDELLRRLIDDGGDHRIEIRDLIMQFEVTAGQGLEADAIGGFQVAMQ